MAATLIDSGSGALSSTQGELPSVTITSADTRSFLAASSQISLTIKSGIRDLQGEIGLRFERLTNTQARVSASRDLPGVESITFDWISVTN